MIMNTVTKQGPTSVTGSAIKASARGSFWVQQTGTSHKDNDHDCNPNKAPQVLLSRLVGLVQEVPSGLDRQGQPIKTMTMMHTQ